MLCFVVAITSANEIGKDGKRGWLLPADARHFIKLTMGHPMIMGRVTYARRGHPFPGRTNIIVTRDPDYQAPGAIITHSTDEAIAAAEALDRQVNIIGGQEIYEQTIDRVDKIYITVVDTKIDGDRFFNFDRTKWKLISSDKHKADNENKYAYEFQEWVRA